jgi:TRAP-type C4-dicarboxylate transport system permease small subunit
MGDPNLRKPSAFSRSIGIISELFGHASGILILVSMLVISYAALLRYIVGASTVWQTELSIYFLMFAAFCGAAYGLKHGDHVKIDLVVVRLPARVQHVVRLAAAILGFVLVAVIAVMAFEVWSETAQAGRRSGTAWNPPLTLPHLILPVGMTLLALQYLVVIVGMVRRIRSGGVGGPAPDGVDQPEPKEMAA